MIPMAGQTVVHQATGEHGASRVLIKPAAPGTGVIAGGAVRQILEAAGVKDALAKSLGSPTHLNVAKAAMNALTGPAPARRGRSSPGQAGRGHRPSGTARRLPLDRGDAGPLQVRILMADKIVKVTLRRSVIGEKPKTRATVESLGLRKLHQTKEHVDSPVPPRDAAQGAASGRSRGRLRWPKRRRNN